MTRDDAHPADRSTLARVIAATWALLATVAAPAVALTPATLVSPELDEREVTLSWVRDGEAAFFDAERRLVVEPTAGLVSIVLPADGEAVPSHDDERPLDRLMLTDGQRLVGRLVGGAASGDSVRFQHRDLGGVEVPLERVAWVGREGTAEPAETAVRDAVTLVNGDTLAGFVFAVDGEALSLSPAEGGDPLPIALSNVAALTLANPPLPPSTRHHAVTLRDGSVLAGRRLDLGRDALSLDAEVAASRSAEVPRVAVARIDFTGYGRRLVPLDAAPEVIDGGAFFGVASPPRLDGDDLVLHAPVALAFPLDAAARRFIATAALDLPEGLSAGRRSLAHVRVGVSLDGEAWQWHVLNADSPAAAINVPLTRGDDAPDRLTLRLDPDLNGPILDRVRLIAPRTLIDEPTAAAFTEDPDL